MKRLDAEKLSYKRCVEGQREQSACAWAADGKGNSACQSCVMHVMLLARFAREGESERGDSEG